MKKKYERDQLFGTNDLRERGWTDGLIARHLPEPDDFRDNPHYSTGAPMKFWLKDTVRKIERRKSFKEDAKKSLRRSVAAKKAAPKAQETRQKNEQQEMDEILAEALQKGLLFREIAPRIGELKKELLGRGRVPDERDLVNLIRHEYTNYDYYAQFLHGDKLVKYRVAVLNSISRSYKSLREECEYQKVAWNPRYTRGRAVRLTRLAKQDDWFEAI